jgi:The GLUG motif.
VGGLVGNNEDSIDNSSATGDVFAVGQGPNEGTKAGGLVGINEDSIDNSSGTGDVLAACDGCTSKVNELVGDNEAPEDSIENSSGTGYVETDVEFE